MTPAKVMKAYAEAGYSCAAWQVWLLPWSKCGCGKRAVLRWWKGRYVYAWFRKRDVQFGGNGRFVCDKCWEMVTDEDQDQ